MPQAIDVSLGEVQKSASKGKCAPDPVAVAAPPTIPSRTRGGSAAATCRGRARSHSRTTGCSSWTHGRRSAATSWGACDNHWRRVAYSYNLAGVLDLKAFAGFALQMMAVRDADRPRSPPTTVTVATRHQSACFHPSSLCSHLMLFA
jgi:hypothetical protein